MVRCWTAPTSTFEATSWTRPVPRWNGPCASSRATPGSGTIWPRFACIKGQYQQAESLASKSNNLASGNRALQARNWKLMAVARKASGNTAGAEEAEAQAAQLR